MPDFVGEVGAVNSKMLSPSLCNKKLGGFFIADTMI